MPLLQKLYIRNWRNVEMAELEFSPSFNCICGDNGQGKTNLLDAVYCLSMTKSAFGIPDACCVRKGGSGYSLSGTFTMQDGLTSLFSLSMEGGRKTLKRDGKQYDKVSSHIGKLPVVMVAPTDGAMISESGEDRRRFVNVVLSQMTPAYLSAIQRYNHLLEQRNRLLKGSCPDDSLISVLDMQMSEPAGIVVAKRAEFASSLEPVVSDYYARLCEGSERVSVSYKSDLLSGGEVLQMEDVLKENCQRDRVLKYTSVGPQRDDFIFNMNGMQIRRFGSQGQQKSFLIALKLAQFDIMKKVYGYPPILILDDVFDKLDERRITNLLHIVRDDGFGQIFISDTDVRRMEGVLGSIGADVRYFIAKNGEF